MKMFQLNLSHLGELDCRLYDDTYILQGRSGIKYNLIFMVLQEWEIYVCFRIRTVDQFSFAGYVSRVI